MEQIFIKTGQYEELITSVVFEDIAPGRKGAILTVDGHVVRSMTKYRNPMQKIKDIHEKLTVKPFNNAMIELYTDRYVTMSYHSDLDIDLVDGSYICIYSCYPSEEKRRRVLFIKDKITKQVKEMVMEDGSMIIFDTNTNKKYLHKIVGSTNWLGITYRLSKTHMKDLRLASEAERIEFFKARSLSNKNVDHTWDKGIDCTINAGDLLQVVESLLSSL